MDIIILTKVIVKLDILENPTTVKASTKVISLKKKKKQSTLERACVYTHFVLKSINDDITLKL